MIRTERVKRRIPQLDLAKLLGVSARTLYTWEQDPRQAPGWALLKLADLFAVSTDYLLGRVNEIS